VSHTETNEWVNADHAQGFLDRRDQLPQLEVGYSELLNILPPNFLPVTIPQDRFQDDPNADWQPRDRSEALFFERRQ